ncbi:MAG: hypothetical protein WBB01_10755 [Phormidesmis sp.]
MKIFTSLTSSLAGWSTHFEGGGRRAVASAFSAAFVGGTVGLGTAGPAVAASPDYFGCTVSMTEAGVAESDAIAACAAARYPEDLGTCVVDVSEFTGLTANSALLVCGRSRRPIEVADCTIDIHTSLLEDPSAKVLENCGRSLLPARYGTCVVDIVDATEATVDEALTQCIQAGYRPWLIQPRI